MADDLLDEKGNRPDFGFWDCEKVGAHVWRANEYKQGRWMICRVCEAEYEVEEFLGLGGEGEHRPSGLGGRGWCYLDSEWCYPEDPCRCCAKPIIRAVLSAAPQWMRHKADCPCSDMEGFTGPYADPPPCTCGLIEWQAKYEEVRDW